MGLELITLPPRPRPRPPLSLSHAADGGPKMDIDVSPFVGRMFWLGYMNGR